MTFNSATVPIFINVRDRVEDLKQLVGWLENAGYENLILLNNASTYEPCVEYLHSSPHTVRHLEQNLGSRAVWLAHLVPQKSFWVYSDPDIIPIDQCPLNLVSYLHDLLQMHPHPKAGPGLYLDDVPRALKSLVWEHSLVTTTRQVRLGVFDSLIDTSFALYRPGAKYGLQALRTGFPYQVRHMPWYRIDTPTEEESYYLERAIKGPMGSSWAEGRQ